MPRQVARNGTVTRQTKPLCTLILLVFLIVKHRSFHVLCCLILKQEKISSSTMFQREMNSLRPQPSSQLKRRTEDVSEDASSLYIWDSWCQTQMDFDYRIANMFTSADNVAQYGYYGEDSFVKDIEVDTPSYMRYVNCSYATIPSEDLTDSYDEFRDKLYWTTTNCAFMSLDNVTALQRGETSDEMNNFLYSTHGETVDNGGYLCSQQYGCLSTSGQNEYVRCNVKANHASYTSTCSMSRLIRGVAPNLGACTCDQSDFDVVDETCWKKNNCDQESQRQSNACGGCFSQETCGCDWNPNGLTSDRHGIPFTSKDFFAWALNDARYENYGNNNVEQYRYQMFNEWLNIVQTNPSAMAQNINVGMKSSCSSDFVEVQESLDNREISGIVFLYIAAVAAAAYCWNWKTNRLHPKLENACTNLVPDVEKE